MSSKICPSCGAVVDGSKFCGVCGTEVPEEQVDRQPAATENAGQPEYSSPYERPAERVKLEKQPEPQMMVPTQAPAAMPMPSVAAVPYNPQGPQLKPKSGFTIAGQIILAVFAGLTIVLSLLFTSIMKSEFSGTGFTIDSIYIKNPEVSMVGVALSCVILFGLVLGSILSKGGTSILLASLVGVLIIVTLVVPMSEMISLVYYLDQHSVSSAEETARYMEWVEDMSGLMYFYTVSFLFRPLWVLSLIFICIGRTRDSIYRKLFPVQSYDRY